MCVALIGVLYAIVLAIILLNSSDVIPEQRRGNAFFAVGYTCWVIPLLVFEVSLAECHHFRTTSANTPACVIV